MNILNKTLLAVLLSTTISGCATVINGTSQDFKMRTDPSGAKVTLTNGSTCETPCEVNLKRRHDLRADIKKDGYKPVYVLIQSRTGGAAAGNLLLGGLIGGVVDGANGASNHLYPNPLKVKLVPVDSTAEAMLLDKNGKDVSTVEIHNNKVRSDVAETIGVEAAGVTTATNANVTPATVSASSEPVAATGSVTLANPVSASGNNTATSAAPAAASAATPATSPPSGASSATGTAGK
jgi:PEGA domain